MPSPTEMLSLVPNRFNQSIMLICWDCFTFWAVPTTNSFASILYVQLDAESMNNIEEHGTNMILRKAAGKRAFQKLINQGMLSVFVLSLLYCPLPFSLKEKKKPMLWFIARRRRRGETF